MLLDKKSHNGIIIELKQVEHLFLTSSYCEEVNTLDTLGIDL